MRTNTIRTTQSRKAKIPVCILSRNPLANAYLVKLLLKEPRIMLLSSPPSRAAATGPGLRLPFCTVVPKAVTLEGSCNSNGAGINLGDGTYSTVRGGANGPVHWKFP